MTVVIVLWIVLVAAAFCGGWYLRALRAVKRGESTARAEREAAIKACSKRHKDACAVYQMDKVQDWTGELERSQLRKLDREQQRAKRDAGIDE